MNRIVIDTNVLLSFLTDRDLRQQTLAARLVEEAARGQRELILHQVVLTELVYVLSNVYDQEAADVAAILSDLIDLPGVLLWNEISWPAVLALWPQRISDFGDACLAAIAKRSPVDCIATFDRTFAKRLQREGLRSHW